jgi:hypothetical protein
MTTVPFDLRTSDVFGIHKTVHFIHCFPRNAGTSHSPIGGLEHIVSKVDTPSFMCVNATAPGVLKYFNFAVNAILISSKDSCNLPMVLGSFCMMWLGRSRNVMRKI